MTARAPRGTRLVASLGLAVAVVAAGGCGGQQAVRTTTVVKTVAAAKTAAPAPSARTPNCVTGTQTVVVLLFGPRSEQVCSALAYRISRTFGNDASPSLDHGSYGSASVFATDSVGDEVLIVEEGADQGDINALIAGVLTGFDYKVKPDWRELRVQ